MHSPLHFFNRTESAVRRLFDGIAEYHRVLDRVDGVVFATKTPFGPQFDAEYDEWRRANAIQISAASAAVQEYFFEEFALSTLCGGVLQVASKALDLFSEGPSASNPSADVRFANQKYCIGRRVRSVPLGIIILAGRNQHTHFNEQPPRKLTTDAFGILATVHDYGNVVDPAFDLDYSGHESLAANVLALIGWRTYSSYSDDMRGLLDLNGT